MVLQVGIVGAGKSGLAQARILQSYPDVRITAVAEPNRPSRDSFTHTFSVPLATSSHSRLASDPNVDVVYVCSPPATHSTIAIDCLSAGKHVVCMPPMAVSVQQANEMLAAAEKSGKRLFVALPYRYTPATQKALQMIDAEEIGYTFMGLATLIANEYDRLNDRRDWKGTWDKGGGGILMERGSEIIDLLNCLFGEVDAVSSVCTRFAIEALNKAEDSCLLDLEFTMEASAQLAITGAARYVPWPESYRESAMRVEVYGVNGSLMISDSGRRLEVSTKSAGHRTITAEEIHTGLPSDMNRDFLDCILEGREPLVTAQEARDVLMVIIAAYKSSQMKRRVDTFEQL